MTYRDVIVLIPCHSLEDFPSEQGDASATGLLNAMTVAWHPQLIAATGQLPRWHRADDPPAPEPQQLYLVPDAANGWLPHDFPERARAVESVVVENLSSRDEWAVAALQPLSEEEVDADLVADFYALGFCWLMVELLTRHMRNFSSIDEIRMQNRTVGAARAVMARDRETAVTHLKSAFEVLLEARERFYPVECYLIDLCLALPDMLDAKFISMLADCPPLNVMVTGADLAAAAEKTPELPAALHSAVAAGRLCFVGGEDRERASPVLPLSSVLSSLSRGSDQFLQNTGTRPTVWGRRRFGLFPPLPSLLTKWGYRGALHVVLDDGIYPDQESTRLRWQSADQSTLDAWSRIPLAADTAVTYLRFPVRLAESMDNDHVAAIGLARWPDVSAPWFHDLRNMQKYAPVLGRFVTLNQFFEVTGSPGRLSAYESKEYFTPFLIQHVARREADPLSRYAGHIHRRHRFDAMNWCRTVAAAVMGKPLTTSDAERVEAAVEAAGPDREDEAAIVEAETQLAAFNEQSVQKLAQLIAPAHGTQPGFLVINPLAFDRRCVLNLHDLQSPPQITGPVKAVDFETSGSPRNTVTVELPGCGFVWIPQHSPAVDAPKKETSRKSTPQAPWSIRHDRFELTLNEVTGGIAQVRNPHKRENRFSQLISFRFPRERTFPSPDGSGPIKSQYAETRCLGHEVLDAFGPYQEIASWGEIIDQQHNTKLAAFQQVTRLTRGKPTVDIEIELSDVQVPDGDPWNNYFCVRFAWDDPGAAITRCLLDGAYGFGGERFESTEYIEIASETERLTIIPHGLPYHRKTGQRMVDSLLIVAGESQRKFRFTVAMDQAYPLEAARGATIPPFLVPAAGPPRSGTSGWLFHLDARNVQLEQLSDCRPWIDDADDAGSATPIAEPGFAVRLVETEGRPRPVRLRCFRQPIRARKRDFLGNTLRELPLEGDAVMIDLAAYEVAEIELRFAP